MAKKKETKADGGLAKGGLKLMLGQVALVRGQAERYRDKLNELRPWWPLLIPFLLWRGKKAYDKEYLKAVSEPKAKS